MLHRSAFKISDDLTLSLGANAVQLRPADGLKMAEHLVRTSMRLAMAQEAVKASTTTRALVAKNTKRA